MMGKIGIYEFLLMPKTSQLGYLQEHGEFIANSIRNGRRYQLHQLHDFFVEIELKTNGFQTFIICLPFKKAKRLEPYLDQLDYNDWM